MTDERTRKQLTAAEFIDIWAGGYKGIKEEDGLVYWEEIDSSNDRRTAVFNFIDIIDDVHIDKRENFTHIKIIDSQLKNILFSNSTVGDIKLVNVSLEEIKLLNRTTTKWINIVQSSITGLIELDIKSEIKGSIILSNKSSVGAINVYNKSIVDGQISIYGSKCGGLRINNSFVNHSFINDSGSDLGHINISDNSFIKEIYIASGTTVGSISISNKSVSGPIQIHKCSVKGQITISKNSATSSIAITQSSISNQLSINENSRIYELSVQARDLRQVSIDSCYIQKLEWKQDTLCMLNINNCQIETLTFENTILPKDSVFQIGRCQVGTFHCSQFINIAWLFVSGLLPLRKYWRFKEQNSELLSGLKPIFNEINHYVFESGRTDTAVKFIASDFGKTSFVECRLDQFDDFVFYNTKLLEVFVAGTPLPKQISLPAGKTAQHEQNDQERLAFGQFKRIYENRGDTVSATDYLALEMDAYHRYLKQPEVIREKGGTSAERFTIWLNKISNNHGTDWLRAVGVTLGVNGIMFAIYCYFLGYEPYVPFYSKIDWHTTLNLFSYSFEFLNPLRKADFLDKVNLEPVRHSWDWVARFWDYVSRIVVAYFVYQTVQAFRRYGKTK